MEARLSAVQNLYQQTLVSRDIMSITSLDLKKPPRAKKSTSLKTEVSKKDLEQWKLKILDGLHVSKLNVGVYFYF